MKKVKLGRVAGPFEQIPFQSYIQFLIGLVPKAGSDQTRLIFHLSYDFGGSDCQQKSVNYHTPKERCSVKYRDLNYAVNTYLELAQEMLDEESDDSDREDDIQTFHSRHALQDSWCRLINNYHQKYKEQKRTTFAGKSDLKECIQNSRAF